MITKETEKICVAYPTLQEQVQFRSNGIELDTYGRPLHPWLDTLPDLPEGKGCFWNWGPNYTVDPIVISRGSTPQLLLIRRGDNGKLALPGGFMEDESPETAALRELAEETGITEVADKPVECYRGPVHDERSTRNAWPATTSLLMHTAEATEPHAGDDASDACWFPLRDVRALTALHGSHAELIRDAVRSHGTRHEKLEYFGDESDIEQPTGGHMGYTRLIATLPTSEQMFVKRHDASRFTDSERETHSRRYLRKEHHIYTSLTSQTPHIPKSVELIDDHTLIMDAYSRSHGWHWRAPEDPALRRRYVEETLRALQSLENAIVPTFSEIKPAYQSIVDEGWGSYDALRDEIVTLLQGSRLEGAASLLADLEDLYRDVIDTPAPTLDAFAHFDIRQSNLAWHADGSGVRVVDWSWADAAPKGVDTTSFLIDLEKSGRNIDEYLHYVNPDYARTLIGFWLGHSTWPTPTPDRTVREHQLGSAIAAYRLLKRLGK